MASTSVALDDKGIPVSNYGEREGQYIGHQRSVVAVADKGLDYWNKSNSSADAVLLSYSWEKDRDLRTTQNTRVSISNFEGMINCADWLMDNAVVHGGAVFWKYNYHFKNGMKPGWRSSHAQGQAILLLIRVYDQTNERAYLEMAERAIQGFLISTEDGGFTEKLSENSWWYLKFASEGGDKPFVLNGMLFALLALQEYSQRFNCALAEDLLFKGLKAVEELLPKFDMGNWSAYNIYGKPCSKHYHKIQCAQLEKLFGSTIPVKVDEILLRWKAADTSGATAGMYEYSAQQKTEKHQPISSEQPQIATSSIFKTRLKQYLMSALGK